ncbi:MAG TPA: glycerate kinase [Jatrophihabitans sp.]|nr:glycerate kinase [Jatrophihabitans sp.]
MRIVAAPDKFRGTADARQIAAAVARAADSAGAHCVSVPLSDGGEGMLQAFGGGNRMDTVTGPLGTPVQAPWRLQPDGIAIIESALACGLALAGGAQANDPEAAGTRGVGELIVAAVRAGAGQVVIGLGGSASTDGGAGAAAVLRAAGVRGRGLTGVAVRGSCVRLVVCCDVTTRFSDAARVFGPQKGAGPGQVARLSARLAAERARVLASTGLDLDRVPGSGAAGGLAGGLAALGAELVPGFDAVAAASSLDAALAGAHLVVTGEGKLDRTSLAGKVVGGVLEHAGRVGVPVLVLAGQVEPDLVLEPEATVLDLTVRYGAERAWRDTTGCVTDAVGRHLRQLAARG